jgi:hypothetical protein
VQKGKELNLRFGFPRVKRHLSYEGNEQFLREVSDGVICPCLAFSSVRCLGRYDTA